MKAGTRTTEKKISFGRELWLLAFIVILSLLVGVRNHEFLTLKNFADIFNDTAILVICAIGMMLVILTGGIDLSIGATLGLSGMVCALVNRAHPGLPMVVIILVGIGTGFLVGAINGILVAGFRVLPIMATLAIMNIVRALIYFVSGGKWVNTYELSKSFISFSSRTVLGISTLVLSAIAIYVIFYIFTNHVRTGRKLYAIGSNIRAAEVSGIKIKKVTFLAYFLLGGLAGFAGMLWTSRYAFASFETGTGFEMSAIAACVLGGVSVTGGRGKIFGVLVGALLIGVINSALPMLQVSSFVKDTIEGVIILVAIIVNALMVRRSLRIALQEREI